MTDHEKAAPSLADEFEALTTTTTANHVIKTAASKQEIGAWATWNQREILAALRAVKAVRAFPKTSPRQIVAETRHEAVAYAFGYRDGVEAVQALLEPKR